MHRHRKPNISSAYMRFTSILSTVSFLLLGTLWIGDALYHFEEDSRLIRQEFMEARKKEVKQEVDVLLAKVEDQRASLNDLLRNDIRARVNEAWSVADNLYRLNATSKSEKDGKTLICLMSSEALSIEEDAYSLNVCHDVTEQKKIQEVMIQSEKMISVGGIAAGIAHEINNPLGIVLQASQNLVTRTRPDFPKNLEVARDIGLDLELLDRYMKERKLHVFIEDIREAGKRAAFIVRNMLDFSRRSESERRLCSMRDIAEKSLSLAGSDYDLKKNYDFKRIRVEILQEGDIPLVFCSETEIEQVFLNLFRNSAQAISDSAKPVQNPRISVRISSAGDWVHIEIDDNGPGIPQEVQRRIFEPFFTTKKPGEGTGLGLSVSYFIITRGHGGRIYAATNEEGGTRFTIELPITGVQDATEERPA
ncbi:MAG: cache domain-containing protein [Desulfomicrobium sp.]|nr:cache domain-containing protein [Pseudomonadota bacterium]MBU4569849.1 cache domain-containing protein [Pseudomonadota bacterium]MBV1711178.1 cache domain-containing protein [Desulfomicrobium sp.]MBV1718932.1 cache domain-containing protein [Desulfomicrobium sp.]